MAQLEMLCMTPEDMRKYLQKLQKLVEQEERRGSPPLVYNLIVRTFTSAVTLLLPYAQDEHSRKQLRMLINSFPNVTSLPLEGEESPRTQEERGALLGEVPCG